MRLIGLVLLTGAAEIVPGLGSLLLEIEAAFARGKTDMEAAFTQEKRDLLAGVISGLQEKITIFRPQVKAASERLTIISFHNHNINDHNYDLWTRSLEKNLLHLGPTSPVVTHLCAMCRMLKKLGYFLQSHPSECTFLSTHFESLLVRAAHISYTCWVDGTTSDYGSIDATEQELIRMLLRLSNEFKPVTPQVIQMCLKLLNKSCSSSSSSFQPSGSREKMLAKNLVVTSLFASFLSSMMLKYFTMGLKTLYYFSIVDQICTKSMMMLVWNCFQRISH